MKSWFQKEVQGLLLSEIFDALLLSRVIWIIKGAFQARMFLLARFRDEKV